MDYEVHGVAKSQTQLSDFSLTLSSKGLTVQFPFIFLTEIPFKSLCWHIFLKNVYIYVCILDNDVKDISDDVEKNTVIRSDQRFKR